MGRFKLGWRVLLYLISTVSLLQVYSFGFKDFVESQYSSILIFLQCCYSIFIILRNECLIMLGPSLLLYILYILLYISALYIFCTCMSYMCILAYWLMLSVLNTTLNKDYSILFYSLALLKKIRTTLHSVCTKSLIVSRCIFVVVLHPFKKFLSTRMTTSQGFAYSCFLVPFCFFVLRKL